MKDALQINNGQAYINSLLQLARCALECAVLELGLDKSNEIATEVLGRDKIREGFQNVFDSAEAELKIGTFLPLEYLFFLFECDLFERYSVILALLAQTDPETATSFQLLQNDRLVDTITPYILCRTYEANGVFTEKYPYFAKGSTLSKYFFCCDDATAGSRLILDRRIISFVLGGKTDSSYYAPAAVLWSDEEIISADHITADRLGAYIRNCPDFGKHTVFNLFGEVGGGRKSCVKQIAHQLGLNLMWIDTAYISTQNAPNVRIDQIIRECMICQAIPAIVGISESDSYLQKAIVDHFEYSFAITDRRLTLLDVGNDVTLITSELGKLTLAESARLWELESIKYAIDPDLRFDELAGEFVLSPGKIKSAFLAASVVSTLHGSGVITLSELKRGCYDVLDRTMGNKAAKVDAVYMWEDLVLPSYQKNMLKTACDQVRFKYNVYQTWGFQEKVTYGKSVSMIFTGPPGTGKTMAAQVVSNELGLDIYKIELATVVSKYVGETEKNLDEIFSMAKKSQVILFFDEADVLFSKRTEVKDANDKYSNMEAAFLLHKMEEYDGVTILATNYIQNFDEAFKRRIKFVIDFPFPNADQRREIWSRVFPQKLPLGELDIDFLASKFELSGSNIKNIAVHSAFLAAADGSDRVDMRHVVAAIRNEYAKSGKMFTKEDAGEYYILL